MLYNQKQRQLIIWEQKETKEIIKSFALLANLGFRLWTRGLSRKYFGVGLQTASVKHHPVLLVNEHFYHS